MSMYVMYVQQVNSIKQKGKILHEYRRDDMND